MNVSFSSALVKVVDHASRMDHEALRRYFGDLRNPEQRLALAKRLHPLELVVDRLRSTSGNPINILDVGCGCGIVSVTLAEMGHSVLGIDIHEGRLDFARKLARGLGLSNQISVVNSDVLTVLSDHRYRANFDIIWAEQSLHHIEPRYRVVSKLAQSLKIGGSLILSEAAGDYFPLKVFFALKGRFRPLTVLSGNALNSFYGNERIFAARSFLSLAKHIFEFDVTQDSRFRVFPSRWLRFKIFYLLEQKIESSQFLNFLCVNWSVELKKKSDKINPPDFQVSTMQYHQLSALPKLNKRDRLLESFYILPDLGWVYRLVILGCHSRANSVERRSIVFVEKKRWRSLTKKLL